MDEDIRILENIKFQCEEILKSLKRHKLSPAVLSDDIIFYNGCCGTIFEIGEQAKHLSKEYCKQHPDIKWKYVIQNRDKIGHHYGDLNVKIILFSHP